jgi:hypothetical protein
MLNKPAIGFAVAAVGVSVYIKYRGFPDLQQEPANVQAQLQQAASMRTSEPMVLILGTQLLVSDLFRHAQRLVHLRSKMAPEGIYGPSSLLLSGAAGYLLFAITAAAFMFEMGHSFFCAVKRYRWKPAGMAQRFAALHKAAAALCIAQHFLQAASM